MTVAVGVQTVWLGVLDHLDREGGDLPALERVIDRRLDLSGCADPPDGGATRRGGADELGDDGGLAARHDRAAGCAAREDRVVAGRPAMGLDLKLTDADGVTLPQQRGVVGHLRVKGPAVVDRYFKAESDALDEEGYFDTGDLAMIDEAGNLTICGRSKDLIKSGGEWINPAEIEAIVGRDPVVGCRRRDRPAGRKVGRAPGADRRSRARGTSSTSGAARAACAARSPTGGFPTRSRSRAVDAARRDGQDRQEPATRRLRERTDRRPAGQSLGARRFAGPAPRAIRTCSPER